MKLKIKKLNKYGKIDRPAYVGDAGYDVYSTIDLSILPHQRASIPLGIAIEFPSDYVCLTQGKSGVAMKYGIDTLGNVIDSSYRGEIHIQIANVSDTIVEITKGMKIAQLLFLRIGTPIIELTDNLSNSERGEKCFGSSGK